ncbi:hypothetical protein J2X85_001652 [Microbacterium trichothecenolyticum]|uniref:hypothetical protein n=1 Tax=Microbacterium trichothecenolyticum TaxID=69370 RepID=UPI002862EAF3|nr:hypothetical protein [Microbacterium trichothecenolyticum]MDR7184629.1 hypothetical protein [Microbacterium trichothecenolyticum]
MGKQTAKARAWLLFDRIIADAAPVGEHSNPWHLVNGELEYRPDIETLQRLLAVPLLLRATVRSRVPALALDVWLAYELRRAGFNPDGTWPRGTHPRILPMPVVNLLNSLPQKERKALEQRLTKKAAIPGVTSSSASILGKNYLKQVDVILSDWATGPEILISTKRMDSSYGKNAANRVEESYGDAKNLRLRHPLAALGFVMGIRSDILTKEPDTFDWLIDLVAKLGQEEDAYHATCLFLIEYGDSLVVEDDEDEEPEDILTPPGVSVDADEPDEEIEAVPLDELDTQLDQLPTVRVVSGAPIDPRLHAGRFLASIVNRTLDGTPINLHKPARHRRRNPVDVEKLLEMKEGPH